MLAGCSGSSVAGTYDGEIQDPESDQNAWTTLEIEQSDDGTLTGYWSLEGEESSGRLTGPEPSGGEIELTTGDTGAFGSSFTIDATVSGDTLEGDLYVNGGSPVPIVAERVSEEEAERRAEERERSQQAAEREEAAAEEERAEIGERYSELDAEVTSAVEDVEGRLDALVDPSYGYGPQEQLSQALGPQDPGSDSFACSTGGASCELRELEGFVESNREHFAEEGYNQEGCEVAGDLSFYEEYEGFDQEGGAEYVELRNEIQDAGPGLQEAAEEAESIAREREEVGEELENAGGSASYSNYSLSDVEALVEDAANAETTASEAVTNAEERYEGYRNRANQAVEEALAMYAQASCSSEE